MASSRGSKKRSGKSGAETFEVRYGNLSVGKELARIRVTIDRDAMSLDQADNLCCGARCDVDMIADPNGQDDDPDQETFISTAIKMQTIADIKTFTVRPAEIAASLSFSIGDLDVSELSHFASAKGSLTLKRIGDCVEEDEDTD